VSDVLIMLIADVGTIGSDDSAQTLKDNGVFLMAAEEYSIFSTSLIQSIADVYENCYIYFTIITIQFVYLNFQGTS
jgi:hypothetical protein